MAGQLLEDRRGRRDRVRAVEQRQLGSLRTGDEAPGDCNVAGDVRVLARFQLGGLDVVEVGELFSSDAEVVSGLSAATFALATTLSAPNLPFTQSMIDSVGRLNIHETSPSAKKFFDRSVALPLTPVSATASLVSSSIGAVIS